MKIFLIFLFILAFLPFTISHCSSSETVNLGENTMHNFYGYGFITFLVLISVLISLILLINLMTKNLEGGKFRMNRKTFLWIAIGVLVLFALVLVFNVGASGGIHTVSTVAEATSNTMVGGC